MNLQRHNYIQNIYDKSKVFFFQNLLPYGTTSQRPFREKLDDPMLFHLQPFLAKVALRVERPVQRADDPVLQPLNVYRDLLIKLFTPRRDHRAVVLETLNRAFAKCTDVVYGTLKIQSLFSHENDDHVVGIVSRLLNVVGKDILK